MADPAFIEEIGSGEGEELSGRFRGPSGHVLTDEDRARSRTPEAKAKARATKRARADARAEWAVWSYQHGMVPAGIANQLGVEKDTVLGWLRAAGVELRPSYGRGVIERPRDRE